MGKSASKIIQSITVVIKLSATKKDFNNIGIHPSSAKYFFLYKC
ncbi:hypothetical protein IQ275_03385 [Nostoc sp. LEGE 12450]|nr:hypothetical protein [Nostoc sp. LEGE 12450]